MASVTFSSYKRGNDVTKLATRRLAIFLNVHFTFLANTWGTTFTEKLDGIRLNHWISSISSISFKCLRWNVEYLALTSLVEILIYSRYILQLERTLYTPYTTAGLEIIPQMDGDWNTCYRQIRLQSTRKVDHGLLQKLPSSFLFLDRPWFGRSCWMANDTSLKVLKKV